MTKGRGEQQLNETVQETMRSYRRKYNEKNREKLNAYARKWRKENPEKVAIIQNRYWSNVAQKAQGSVNDGKS